MNGSASAEQRPVTATPRPPPPPPPQAAIQAAGLRGDRRIMAVQKCFVRRLPTAVAGFLAPTAREEPPPLRMILGLDPPRRRRRGHGRETCWQLARPATAAGALLDAAATQPHQPDHVRCSRPRPGSPVDQPDQLLDQVGLAHAARRRPGAARSACGSSSRSPPALLGETDVLHPRQPAERLDPPGVRSLHDLLGTLAAEQPRC